MWFVPITYTSSYSELNIAYLRGSNLIQVWFKNRNEVFVDRFLELRVFFNFNARNLRQVAVKFVWFQSVLIDIIDDDEKNNFGIMLLLTILIYNNISNCKASKISDN